MSRVTGDSTCQRPFFLVYSQHWLLFTGSRRCKTSYKWLLQFMTSVTPTVCTINHVLKPFYDPHTQKSNCAERVVTAKIIRLFWEMHFNPAGWNEDEHDWKGLWHRLQNTFVTSIAGYISKEALSGISLPLLGWRWGCLHVLAGHEWREGRRLMI